MYGFGNERVRTLEQSGKLPPEARSKAMPRINSHISSSEGKIVVDVVDVLLGILSTVLLAVAVVISEVVDSKSSSIAGIDELAATNLVYLTIGNVSCRRRKNPCRSSVAYGS